LRGVANFAKATSRWCSLRLGARTDRPERTENDMVATEHEADDRSTRAVKSADRVLAILEYLATEGKAPFGAIVRDLGLPLSSAHQLLQTILWRGFIELDESTRLFKLGFRLWEVAQSYAMTDDLVSLAQPLMDELTSITTETVQLARLEGIDNVYLAISESPHPMKLVSSVGKRLPAHATGLGKVLLASLDAEELDRRLSGVTLARFTERTITDRAALLGELKRVRAKGFGYDNEEYVIGCRCVAAPVRDAIGHVVAAMSVSVPTPRFNQEVAQHTRTALKDTVRRLEARMSGPMPRERSLAVTSPP
jgi:DNA-binding IclR family transcriptional regulator